MRSKNTARVTIKIYSESTKTQFISSKRRRRPWRIHQLLLARKLHRFASPEN